MAAASATSARPVTPSPTAILQMLAGRWVCGAVTAAARLGIADQLARGARSSDELAPRLRAHAPSLYRLMRALASLGLLSEVHGGRFALTSLGAYLRSDVPGSMLGVAQFFASEEHGAAWSAAAYSVASGEPAFAHLFGRTLCEYLDDDPELAAIYSHATASLASVFAPEIVERLAVGPARTVADVGGGTGTLLAAILKRHPQLRGILYERPATIAAAARGGEAVLRERCELVAGDFLRSVPAADLILLSRVLHDWSDTDAVRILANCRSALPPHGRVAAIECAIVPGDEPDLGKLLDLEMLVVNNGRERTRTELETLFQRAGLRPVNAVALASGVIVEAVRASQGEP